MFVKKLFVRPIVLGQLLAVVAIACFFLVRGCLKLTFHYRQVCFFDAIKGIKQRDWSEKKFVFALANSVAKPARHLVMQMQIFLCLQTV